MSSSKRPYSSAFEIEPVRRSKRTSKRTEKAQSLGIATRRLSTDSVERPVTPGNVVNFEKEAASPSTSGNSKSQSSERTESLTQTSPLSAEDPHTRTSDGPNRSNSKHETSTSQQLLTPTSRDELSVQREFCESPSVQHSDNTFPSVEQPFVDNNSISHLQQEMDAVRFEVERRIDWCTYTEDAWKYSCPGKRGKISAKRKGVTVFDSGQEIEALWATVVRERNISNRSRPTSMALDFKTKSNLLRRQPLIRGHFLSWIRAHLSEIFSDRNVKTREEINREREDYHFLVGPIFDTGGVKTSEGFFEAEGILNSFVGKNFSTAIPVHRRRHNLLDSLDFLDTITDQGYLPCFTAATIKFALYAESKSKKADTSTKVNCDWWQSRYDFENQVALWTKCVKEERKQAIARCWRTSIEKHQSRVSASPDSPTVEDLEARLLRNSVL